MDAAPSRAQLSRARIGAKAIRATAARRWTRLAALDSPPDPTTSPWLAIAAPVGRIGTLFLIASNFLFLFAPLMFLANAQENVDTSGPGAPVLLLLSDPGHLLAIGDFVGVLGTVILACAVFVILLGLIRADRPVGIATYALGVLVFACLVTWVPVTLWSQGAASGDPATVDAAAATGGWGLASLLLLAASVAYLFFTMRVENGTRALRLGSFKWPIYAAVNVLGSAAIAGFFSGGGSATNVFSLGLALRVTLVPLLGVMAYSDLRDRFPAWAQVPLHEPPAAPPRTEERRPAPLVGRLVRPIPPPPDD